MPNPDLHASLNQSGFDPSVALEQLRGEADWISLRFVEETQHRKAVRNQRLDSNEIHHTRGVMIEVLVEGQLAYAATSDLSRDALIKATRGAVQSARNTSAFRVFGYSPELRPPEKGRVESPCELWLDQITLESFTSQLIEASRRLKISDKIETALAEASLIESLVHIVSSSGADLRQHHRMTYQHFAAIARDGCETQSRSLNGAAARCLMRGLESFNWAQIHEECETTGQEAIELLSAQNCPDGTLDLLLAPDQMLIQIHETVGHPLELDRILGDERNYAGWSFIKPQDFGQLQYGSPLMNIVFDPDQPGEFAGYQFDDGGARANREYLIRDGRLLRGIGGLESQARIKLPGVSSFRASSWNRAPIDRMANINLLPGNSSLDDLIGGIERGVFMQANRSWSIDDYRNKFQFGCEFGRLIEDGRLTRIVKNPNYRGISLPFWHALDGVGNALSFQSFGTPYCGKGEPNQMIRVGHAAPACRFRNIEIFGGSQ